MPIRALWTGTSNLLRYWKLILLLQGISVLVAAFPAFLVGDAIRSSLEESALADNLRSGFDDLWFRHFQQQATGLPATFDPGLTGAGAILGPLDDLLTGKLFSQKSAIPLLGTAYFLVWVFFSGGWLSLLWTRNSLSWPLLLSDGLRFFGRLLLLGAIGLLGYWILLVVLHGWLREWIEEATRNLIDERRMFRITLLKYGFLWILAGAWMAWLDGARVLVVAGDAGIGEALRRSSRLLLRASIRVAGLYVMLLLLLAALVTISVWGIPGAGQAGFFSLSGFLVASQVLFFLRLVLRLQRPAALMELYRPQLTPK